MIVDQLFDNNKNTNESLADEFMAIARAKGMNPRLRGTPDEERARTDAMMKQRAADRANAPAPEPVGDEERARLQARLKELEAKFDPNYEYSDDHSFWTQQRGIAQQIGAIKQKLSQGVAEGWTKLPSGDYQNSHTGVRTSKPPVKKKRGEKTGAEWDAIKAKKEQGVAEGSKDSAPKMSKQERKLAQGALKGAKDMSAALGLVRDKDGVLRPPEPKKIKESRLNEAMLMEDPVYRKFKTVGRYIAERKMSEKEILQVFADAETGMTDKATGANRTMLGRGKDTTMDFAGGVADALKGVWSGIQNSVPVAAVDVAYDQATDALAGLTGGQKGAVMQAIKKYRNLAKQYPKTAGLAKGALVAITGLATGGAGLPAVAALVYGLDSAIKGEKLSDIALKAGGAAATAWAGQKIASAFGGDQAAGGANTNSFDPSQMPAYDDAGNLMPGFHINPESGQAYWTGDLAPTAADSAAGVAGTGADAGAAGFGGGTYTTMPGDQGGFIAQANGVPFEDLKALNPQITNWNKLPPGTELQLPPSGPNTGSVWGSGDVATGGATSSAAIPAPTGAPTMSVTGGGGAGTITNGDVAQLMQTQAFKDAYAQNVAKFGSDAAGHINATRAALAAAKASLVRESVNWTDLIKMRKLSFDKLVDEKATVMNWALSESVGVKRKSVSLSAVGTLTVFENVDRVRKAVISELAGVPGSTRPEYYRPDMPGGPGKQSKPGLIGRGLNWLDKAAGKVGGALSNFGHQFTTNVTKEKLKMNWHQAGKPSDSDQLAAWLVKQGVPQEVVTGIYGKMGIPYTAPAAPAAEPAATPAATPAAEPAATTGGAQKQMAFYGTNPDTQKPWTYDELQAKARASQVTPTAGAEPTAEPAPGPTTKPTTGPATFNAGNIFKQPGMEKYAKPAAPAKTPNFAGPGGYGKTTTTIKPMTGVPGIKPATAPATTATLPASGGAGVKAAAPAGTRVVSGGPTPDEQAKLAQRIAQAAKQPVAEMLAMVETKEDVQRIKQFIDQTFVKYGAVSESAFVVRNKLIEHVTQVGAQRRREFARKS